MFDTTISVFSSRDNSGCTSLDLPPACFHSAVTWKAEIKSVLLTPLWEMKSPLECSIPKSQHWLVGQLVMPGSAHSALAEKRLEIFLLTGEITLMSCRPPRLKLLLLLLLWSAWFLLRCLSSAQQDCCTTLQRSSAWTDWPTTRFAGMQNAQVSQCETYMLLNHMVLIMYIKALAKVCVISVPVFVCSRRRSLCGHSLGWLHSFGLQIHQHQEGPDGLCVF